MFTLKLRPALGALRLRKTLMQLGFDRLFVANQIIQLEDWLPDRRQTEIPVLADRLILKPAEKARVLDSLELAFRFGGGRLDVWIQPDGHYAFSSRLHDFLNHDGTDSAAELAQAFLKVLMVTSD